MADWITLATTDLRDVMSEAEWAQFNSAVVQGTEGAKLEGIFTDVIGEVQGYIPGVIGQPGTIPPECRNAALTLIKDRVFGLVTSLRRFKEAIKDDVDRAVKYLEGVAAGKNRVSRPDYPAEEAPQGGSAATHNAPPRVATREKLDGL